jgi:colanic acid/amylovoran biosynthesis protein
MKDHSVPPQLALFGMPGDTQNLGVSALQVSAVAGLLRRIPEAKLTVFDHGRGRRREALLLGGQELQFNACGGRRTRRIFERESLLHIRLAALLGGAGNPGTLALKASHAVLDVSGGDSFSDIYGMQRFRTVMAPKKLALVLGLPLLLLPQTYGPYRRPAARRQAREMLRRAAVAWARDADSYAQLQELLGDAFDESRHKPGVEMAFGLPAAPPAGHLTEPLDDWIRSDRDTPTVGLNVSGHTYFLDKYGGDLKLSLDYRQLLQDLVRHLLAGEGVRILLLAHVLGRGGSESDERANEAVLQDLAPSLRERVALAPTTIGPMEAKWLISRCDWFCGTRMHSCVAGLSSGVPTSAVAYSMKTRGVVATYGQENRMVDGRTMATGEALELLLSSWQQRNAIRSELDASRPMVARQVDSQMDDIAAQVTAFARG